MRMSLILIKRVRKNCVCLLFWCIQLIYQCFEKAWSLNPMRFYSWEDIDHLLCLDTLNNSEDGTKSASPSKTIAKGKKEDVFTRDNKTKLNCIFLFYLQWTVIGPFPDLRWTLNTSPIRSLIEVPLSGHAVDFQLI